MMLKDSHKQFQGRVVHLAKLCDFEHIYHTWSSRNSPAGYPDLILLKGKRLIVIELKMPGDNLAAEQYFWLLAFREVTPEVYVCWPDDWEEIEGVLRKGMVKE